MLGLQGSSGERFFVEKCNAGVRGLGDGGVRRERAGRHSKSRKRAREHSGGIAVGIRWAGCGRGMGEADEMASR